MSFYTGTGTIGFIGSADYVLILQHSASGSLSFSGVADVISTNYNYSASGSLRFSGVAPVVSSSWATVASGGLGTGDSTNASLFLPVLPGGFISLGGNASSTLILSYIASGGLTTGGVAALNFNVSLTTTFTWDVSQGVLRTWRVEGKCRPSNHSCPPTYNDDTGCAPNSSTMQFVANVQAHSVTDLCVRLKDRGLTGPIKKIQMWSLPVNKSDWTSADKADCNKLTTISFDNIPECLDFTVNQDLMVTGKMSASIIYVSDFAYVASGGLSRGGGIETPVLSYYAYVASGGLNIDGNVTFSSPQYHFYLASGGLITGGVSNAYGSDYGTLMATGKSGIVILDLGAVFGSQAANVLVPSVDLIPVSCCDSLNLPQILFARHELARSYSLSNFLAVNGLTLPSVLSLMYSSSRNSWYYNKQLRGMSVDQNSNEVWNVILEFGCLTENALLGVPSNIWGFTILVRRLNLFNSRVDVTRLVTEFDPILVCDLSSGLKFNFSLDVSNMTTNPATVRTVVVTDEVGIFKGSSYTGDVLSSFEIGSAVPNLGAGMFDQSIPFRNMLLSIT